MDDLWLTAGLPALVGVVQRSLVAFLLVVIRLSGLMALSPVLGHPNIPRQVRVLLILAMSLLIVPAVFGIRSEDVFQRWDANRDGKLSSTEVPQAMQPHYRRMLAAANTESLGQEEFELLPPAPATLVDFTWLAIGEFAVGFALSLGVLTVLSAVQLAGHLIDYQTGLSLGQIFNPQFGSSSMSSEFLLSLGTTVYLIAGGHLLLVDSLIQTFQAVPVGYAAVPTSAIELLKNLVQQSLILALQMSAPIVLTLTLVGFAMGVLGHTVTTINFIDVGIPVRILIGLFIFSLALARLVELLAMQFPQVLSRVTHSLGGG